MKDTGAVAVINKLIRDEFLANHTYLIQARMCDNWGYKKLAEHLMKEAAEEIGHATILIDRVLLLDGLPDTTRPEVTISKSVEAMIEHTVTLERKAVTAYRDASVECLKLHDLESMHMFQALVKDEEGHLHWAETQLNLIKEIGMQNFLTEWM